jgi:tetraacyldisaccharide 4'-kinase
VLSPSIVLYYIVIKLRNYFFDRNIFKTHSVNAKVISIGNITVGGSGKTPAVILVTKLLKEAGKKVGVLSRGYRRKSTGYLLVSEGNDLLTSVNECGDEMYLIADECKVPAAVAEKRVEGARNFLTDVDVDTIILDDAYQHRWIARDLNILMFDQRFLHLKGKMERTMLPTGVMREPFSSVKRADIVIINQKFSEKKEIPVKYLKYFESKKIFFSSYKATGIYDIKNQQFFGLNEFEGQKSLVVCGIARPYSFLKSLEKNNVSIKNKLIFPDHNDYSMNEVQTIRKKFYDTNSHSVLTTQKDAVKLINYSRELDDIDIYYLKIELHIENTEEFNKLIFKSIK